MSKIKLLYRLIKMVLREPFLLNNLRLISELNVYLQQIIKTGESNTFTLSDITLQNKSKLVLHARFVSSEFATLREPETEVKQDKKDRTVKK